VAAVTPSDATILDDFAVSGVYVGTTGNVAVETYSGDTVTFTSVAAGSIIPVQAYKVLSTGTTASNMVIMGQ
jgi:hypothetical protein